MNMKVKSTAGLAAAALLMSVAIAAPSHAASTVSDSDITSWVSDALTNDDRVDNSMLIVSTENGIVTLSGSVDNLAAKRYADMEAKKIAGVLGVINEIAVAPRWRSDTDIRHAVRRRILNSAVIESEGLRVTSVDGRVTLSGEVASWTEREEAGLLASEVRGVKEVQNNITTQWSKTKRSDQEIKDDVVAALERDVYLSGLPITVSVKDGVVTLTGSVGSAYEKDRARSDAQWISHVKDVEDEVNIEWSDSRGVRKKESVPSEAELRENVRAELDQDRRIDASGINIKEASLGHVTLDGSVYSHHEKRIAEQDTRDVVGVYWVTNKLFARVDRREDEFIRGDVSFNLKTDYVLEGSNIDTKVNDGVVTLSGEVHNWYDKSHAGNIAAKVRGVKDVINEISVKQASISEEHSGVKVVKDIENRFWWNWTVHSVRDQIHVSVKKGVATLTGDVDTWAQRREAQAVAFNTKGVWSVMNRLTVNGYHYPWGEWEREYPDGYPYYSDYPPYSW